jgi:hypothetical protein
MALDGTRKAGSSTSLIDSEGCIWVDCSIADL